MELDGLITGWRAIGKFLGVTDRTARTYHFVYGMPVRRLPGNKRCILPEEVKTWLVIFSDKKAELKRKKEAKWPACKKLGLKRKASNEKI